jgi:hypothetical protein
MILGQINPPLSIVRQDTLFNPTTEFITGSYLTAVANQYVLGAHKVNFRISYGECIFDGDTVVEFKTIHSDNVELSGDDIADWGSDDSVVLKTIAQKQGTSVIGVVSGDFESGRFF